MIHLHKRHVVIFTHLILFFKLMCVFSVVDHKLFKSRTRVQRIQCQCWIFHPCWPRGLPKAKQPVSFLFSFCFNHVLHFNNFVVSTMHGTMMENLFFIPQVWLWFFFWAQICGQLWWEGTKRVQEGTHFYLFSLSFLLQSIFFVLNTHAATYLLTFCIHITGGHGAIPHACGTQPLHSPNEQCPKGAGIPARVGGLIFWKVQDEEARFFVRFRSWTRW